MKKIIAYLTAFLFFIFALVTYPAVFLAAEFVKARKHRTIKRKIKELEDKILETKKLWENQT